MLVPAAAFFTSAEAAARAGLQPSDRIPAGRIEVVSLEPATSGAEERELVLSLDGGKTFPLRLTGEIGPGDREASWRVPALPTEHAVLALREGDGGFEEEIVAVSAEFSIVPDAGVPAEDIRFREGEWKTREADTARPGLPSSAFGSAERRYGTLPDDARASLARPSRALLAIPSVVSVPGRLPAHVPLPGGPFPVPLRSPFLPLRE